MGDVPEFPATSPRLLVSVSGLAPGAPLDIAVALADALDARRVPSTLLVGPRPHPEVVAWAVARRHVGDAALLHGTHPEPEGDTTRSGAAASKARHRRPYRRLPAHEAGLRLTAALRTRDALGLPVDGFAAPGWSTSAGVSAALAAAGVGLCLDDTGVHRLGPDGTPVASRRGPVITPRPRPAPRGRPWAEPGLVHLALDAAVPAARAGDLVDRALGEGAAPAGLLELLAGRAPRRTRPAGDPEHWSITA